nr:MAG TPA: hypothetical protein [Bacteriophage sp.]
MQKFPNIAIILVQTTVVHHCYYTTAIRHWKAEHLKGTLLLFY